LRPVPLRTGRRAVPLSLFTVVGCDGAALWPPYTGSGTDPGWYNQRRGGGRSDHRNVITRGIGLEEAAESDSLGIDPLPPDGVLLLCSDGLHGPVAKPLIAAALTSGTADAMAERLIGMVNQAGGPDNISVVILKG